MGLLHESLQQVCLSIEKLEPSEESLPKLLSLAMAAHLLLADEDMHDAQADHSQTRHLALEKINALLEERIYLRSRQEQLHRFGQVKGLTLQSLDRMHK